MPTPSLILVPARFKTGKLYTPLATTSGGVVLGASGDFNVTRATTATRFNSAGLIESVASGVPRLDYYTSGGTAGCPALLVEPSAQNVALRSAGMEVSGTWQRSNISVTTGITSPEGLTTAFNIVESSDVTAQTHELAQGSFSVVSGTTYTFSVFVKSGVNNRNIRLAFGSTYFAGSPIAFFNPTSGTVVSSTDCTANIENYGNGWFRCRITATADLNGSSFLGMYPASGTSVTYIGNGSGSVQVWGAQAETGSIATSYIPTTTAAVTRNADVISVTGAVSGCIGQTEGTIYWEGSFGNAQSALAQDGFQIGINANNYIYFGVNSGRPYFRLRANAINAVTISPIGNVIQNNQKTKIAIAYKSGDSALFVNGTQIGSTNTTAFTFASSLSVVEIGSNLSLSSSEGFSNSPKKPQSFTFYTTRLTDTQLAALTTL